MRRSRGREQDGAIRVLRECLSLKEGTELLIIADETGLGLARELHAAARRLAARSLIVFVAAEEQRQVRGRADLHLPLVAALGAAQGAVNCLSADPSCTDFRGALVEQRRVGLRIAHMPGATRRLLGNVMNVDYAALQLAAETLTYPLFLGKRIEIRTAGNHVLAASLDGRKHVPVPSTGVIADGSWGNIPAAETYVSPVRGSAEGTLLVDGSLLKHTVGKKKPLVLEFGGGLLRKYVSRDPTLSRAMRDFERLAQSRNERNWTNVAEIGIGLNPSIRRLTGNALLDEKKARTAHVALGRSKGFGGDVNCAFHEDVVFKRPTISVDGRVIVDHGVTVATSDEWLERLVKPAEAVRWGKGIEHVFRGTQSVAVREGLLFQVFETGPGRSVSLQIGCTAASALAREVYDLLPESVSQHIRVDDLVLKGRSEQQILATLRLLEQRGLALVHRHT